MKRLTQLTILFCAITVLMFTNAQAQQPDASQAQRAYLPALANTLPQSAVESASVPQDRVAQPREQNGAVIASFSPTSGAPGAIIHVVGNHFVNVVAVTFGDVPASSFTVADEHNLNAIVPTGAHSGKLSVITLSQSAESFSVAGGAVDTPTNTPLPVATDTPTNVAPTATNTHPAPTEAATATNTPPNATTTPTSAPSTSTAIPSDSSGIWISKAEIMALPTSGPGWQDVKAGADSGGGVPSLSNQDSKDNTETMARALVCARTGDNSYCSRVITTIRAITTGNYESGTRALALGRELVGYVIAADTANLKALDPTLDAAFRVKLKALLAFKTTGGPANLIECDNIRPNNWGGHCGSSRIAVDLYLGDRDDLAKAALVLQGWLGDRSAYAGFAYGDLEWQSDPAHPVGVNPVGGKVQGFDVSGAQPEELRRATTVRIPPFFTEYGWEGLQGRLASTYMLYRAGYDSWNWSDKAMLRAVQFLYSIKWPAKADDQWQIWLINQAYHVDIPTTGGGSGKGVGWTRWTTGN